MPKIRTLLLDGMALTACCAELLSSAEGYARSLSEPPKPVVARVWFDPETTTSITPKDETGATGKRGQHLRSAKPAELGAGPSKAWVDPSYRKRAW